MTATATKPTKQKPHTWSDLSAFVTQQIIALLEEQQRTWNKPWVSLGTDGKMAHNASSQTPYRGVNQILLSMIARAMGYPLNGWLTFLQVKQLGGTIRKGEKASKIFFSKRLWVDKDGNKYDQKTVAEMDQALRERRKVRQVYILKKYLVFNLAQIEGLPESFYHYQPIEPLPPFERDNRTEELIAATGATIMYRQGNDAYYAHKRDEIVLPLREQFTSTQGWASVALHEVAHWTAHPKRLNRPLNVDPSSKAYAYEELIAELSAAFLCAHLGFEKIITNQAAYVQHWIKILRGDQRLIFIAAHQAEKAADFILEASGNPPRFQTPKND